jgi:glycosyltransferase involved in cell wall biosynthesis
VESTPLVSIVTPFYNTREFLAECIESVLRQTYRNWEYILVNNGSTDGSSEIAAHYASLCKDRIRVIRTESFLSQVQNYNFALTCISPNSKYCKMVQADDWIFPDCVRSMVEVAESHPNVGIVAAYELRGQEIDLDGLPYPAPEISGRDVCRLYFLNRTYLFGTPTSLLMRSDLVRSRVPFYEERYAPFEDGHACFDFLKTWNFGFVHQVLTHSRRGNDSILSRIEPFGFLLFARFAFVVVYGRDYLSDREYDECFKDAEREYFLFLGKAVLVGKSKDFWEFHRTKLASINWSLDWQLLSKWAALAMIEFAGNPKQTWDSFRARRRRRASGNKPC